MEWEKIIEQANACHRKTVANKESWLVVPVRPDIRFLLEEAYKHAREYSTDPSTQNGALIVNDQGEIAARGANHFPHGVHYSPNASRKSYLWYSRGYLRRE